MSSLKMVAGVMAILVALVLIVELGPPYWSNYELQDTLDTEAQLDTYSNKSIEEIQNSIVKKAREMSIPISKEQVMVQRTGPPGSGAVIIEANYTVRVNLPGYPMDVQFNAASKNKAY
jgi:type III secretion system FlhB-like substrate exporter